MRLILDDTPVLFLLFFAAVSVTLLVISSQAKCTLWDITWRGFFCCYQTVRYEHLVEIVARRKQILVEDTDRTELISCH
jgi:hypothetical protein